MLKADIRKAIEQQRSGNFSGAEKTLERVIKEQPNNIDSWLILGNLYIQAGENKKAIDCYRKLEELRPNDSSIYNNLAVLFVREGEDKKAEYYFKKFIELNPNSGDGYSNLGEFYRERKKLDLAKKYLLRAIDIKPRHSNFYNNLANVYQDKKDYSKAIEFYEKAIEFKPDFAKAYNNLGTTYKSLGKGDRAIELYKKALELNPNYEIAYFNLGNVCNDLNRLDEAIAFYKRAIEIKPNYSEAGNNLGNIYLDRSQVRRAIDVFRKIINDDSRYKDVYHNFLFTLHYISDRKPEEIYREHREWAKHRECLGDNNNKFKNIDRNRERKIRVGYVSADFRTHSVAYFFESILDYSDREKFEIVCYSNNRESDLVTERLKNKCDLWREIRQLRDADVVDLIREDKVDILVDLSGHTNGNRLLVFAEKSAPVQVTYLGYPNTTGLKTIDYRLTDNFADPIGTTEYLHSEKLIRLPHGFLCYTPPQDIPNVKRSSVIDRKVIRFGSFNKLAKVSDETIEYWASILKSVPNSILVIKSKSLEDDGTKIRIYKLFERQGIKRERLELRGRIKDKYEHFNLYNEIDIALDTFPYHGTTTTCEALYMGVPVISLAGKVHVSRVGVSLLSSIGLKELIATSEKEYIQKAIKLAKDRDRLEGLHNILRTKFLESSLTNAKKFTRSLESSYTQMWINFCSDRESEDRQSVKDKVEIEKKINLALLYDREGDYKKSIALYRELIQLKPKNPNFYFNLAQNFQKIGNSNKAIEYYKQVIKLKPDYGGAYNNLGNIYNRLGKFEPAIACYEKAIQINPNDFNVYNNLASVYNIKGDSVKAIDRYKRSIELNPNCGITYSNLASVYKDRADLVSAIKLYRQSLKLNPDYTVAHQNLLFCLHYPSELTPKEIYKEHKHWANKQEAIIGSQVIDRPKDKITQTKRLRIGYISGDFRNHPVANFFEPLMIDRDSDNFYIICYANNIRQDETTVRFKNLVDEWRDIYTLKDLEVAKLIKQDKIDILVDLSGHSADNRLPVLTQKPAPIQVTYLGYPNTTGLSTIDYRLTDNFADPIGKTEHLHSEQLIRLPHGFLCYLPPLKEIKIEPLPVLKNKFITFGSFNNLAKVSNQIIIYWSEILQRVPHSKLILKSKALKDTESCNRIYKLFLDRGINRERLNLMGWVKGTDNHLSLYNKIDIALDTFPYHGTTTTCEALYMGVPVITLEGKVHVSRVGVSLLSSIGYPELITSTQDEYIQKAVSLSQDISRLKIIRSNLRKSLMNSSLTNGKLITQDLESVYKNMWINYSRTIES